MPEMSAVFACRNTKGKKVIPLFSPLFHREAILQHPEKEDVKVLSGAPGTPVSCQHAFSEYIKGYG